MPTISVRISEQEKRKLLEYGSLSNSIREALNLYLDTKKSEELIGKLGVLQRSERVRTTAAREVDLIREDRRADSR